MVRKMQADRDSYMSERRGSYSEAIEMVRKILNFKFSCQWPHILVILV